MWGCKHLTSGPSDVGNELAELQGSLPTCILLNILTNVATQEQVEKRSRYFSISSESKIPLQGFISAFTQN